MDGRLSKTYAAVAGKILSATEVVSAARSILDATPDIQVDYLEIRGADLGDAPEEGDARLLVAARIGAARLIDNVGVPLGVGFKNLDPEAKPE